MLSAARDQADRELEQARVTLAADTAQARAQLEQDARQLGEQLADRLAGRTH
jgi:F0F1-type ATP synthase membrane subunit b/b'